MSLRRVVFALAMGLTSCWPGAVSAASVAVLSDAESDCSAAHGESASRGRDCVQQIEETVTRVSAELATAGFNVVSLPRVSDAGSDLSPSDGGLTPAPVGVFSVTQIDAGPAIEVRLTDRSTGEILRFTLRAASSAFARAPALLAVRALELVRANALVLDLAPQPQPAVPAPAPPIVQPESPPPAVRPPRFTFQLGAAAALFLGFKSLGPALAPLVTAGVTTEHGLGLHGLGAGPSLGPALRGRDGLAAVSEAFAAVALDYRVRPIERLAVVFSLGAGAHHLSVRGKAREPFVATQQQVWSTLALAGVGARARLSHKVALSFDLLAYATFPRLVVHVAEQTVGAVSRPSTLTALGLCVEL